MLMTAGLLMMGLFGGWIIAWMVMPSYWNRGVRGWFLREAHPKDSWGFVDLLVVAVMYVVVQLVMTGIGMGLGFASWSDLGAESLATQGVSTTVSDVRVEGGTDAPIASVPSEGALTDAASSQEVLEEAVSSDLGKVETDGQGSSESEGEQDPARMARVMKLTIFVMTGNLLVVVLSTVWVMMRTRVSAGRVGWSLKNPLKDVVLAGGAMVLFIPAIYLSMGLVNYLFSTEYEHPIIEMMRANPWMIGMAVWMACVIAPITEEFAFRVLLQGFLEAQSRGRFSVIHFLLGWNAGTDELVMSPPGSAVVGGVASIEGGDVEAEHGEGRLPFQNLRAWWPIGVTGILFGLVHFEYGMSWIPLSLLGMVLGWLYHMTHRVWPCILLHMAFNSLSMLGMAGKILSEQVP